MNYFTSLVVVALLSGPAAHAEKRVNEGYLTIGSVEITERTEGVEPAVVRKLVKSFRTSIPWAAKIDVAEVIFDKVVNLGKKVWTLVEKGKPVVNLRSDVASAMPQGLTDWMSLEGWQTPVSKVYTITYKNLYGMNVVTFSYRVIYTYGGNYRGLGRYLTQVTVIPADVRVAFLYRLDAEALVPSVVNAGTRENPVGAAEITVRWKVTTKPSIRHMEESMSFFVKGNGEFVNLTNGTLN